MVLERSCKMSPLRAGLLQEVFFLAYVLTLLPGRVFQVFQVVEGGKKREKTESIDNSFEFIITIYICSNASTPV